MTDQHAKTAAKIHQESIIIDPCVQYLVSHTARSERSGLTAVGLTIPMPGDDLVQAVQRVPGFLDTILQEPAFCLADTPQSIRDAKRDGKIAHILLSQDSLLIGSDPKNVLIWKQLGLRVMQLTYNEQNLAGTWHVMLIAGLAVSISAIAMLMP